MWSDRHRALKVLALLALVAGLGGLYAWHSLTLLAAWPKTLEAGQAADGRELRFSLWEVNEVQGPRRYVLKRVVEDVPVEGDATGLSPGDTVTVVGRFRAADGVVVAEIQEVHHNRRYKELLGYIGVAAALVAAPFGFRWRHGRLVERG